MQEKNYINLNNKINFKNSVIKNLVSVIIPAYKDAKGLHDTLSSLQEQTLDKGKFEIIVANDGNDLEVSRICQEFKVIEIKITPNRGSYNARNKALEKSKGEFLAFTDADVVVSINWLEKGVYFLKKYDYVAGTIIRPDSKKLNLTEKYLNLWEFNIKKLFNNDHYGVTANLFVKRKIFHHVGGFDSRLQSGGDNEFGSRLYIYSNFLLAYTDKIKVIHPYRNFKELISKKIRIYKGLNDLVSLYSERYTEKFNLSYYDLIFNHLRLPAKKDLELKLYLFVWFQNAIDLYLILRYMQIPRKFFSTDSYVYKKKHFLMKMLSRILLKNK